MATDPQLQPACLAQAVLHVMICLESSNRCELYDSLNHLNFVRILKHKLPAWVLAGQRSFAVTEKVYSIADSASGLMRAFRLTPGV